MVQRAGAILAIGKDHHSCTFAMPSHMPCLEELNLIGEGTVGVWARFPGIKKLTVNQHGKWGVGADYMPCLSNLLPLI